jgi:thioredoxin-related protein
MIAAKGYRGGLLALLLMSGMFPSTAQDTNRFEQAYPQVQHISLQTLDQNNASVQFDSAALYLFVFLSPECPLSQNYTLVLNNLEKKFGKELKSYGIIPGRAYSIQEVRQFAGDYKLEIPVWIDLKKELSNYLQATVTPEVVLLNKKGELIYRGAIDDWVEKLGQKKVKARVHYLEDAIKAYLDNKSVRVKSTKPVGCLINEF